MTQEQLRVKEKIIQKCKEYNLTPPTVWNYKNVKAIAEKINAKASAESWGKELDRLQDNDHLWD